MSKVLTQVALGNMLENDSNGCRLAAFRDVSMPLDVTNTVHQNHLSESDHRIFKPPPRESRGSLEMDYLTSITPLAIIRPFKSDVSIVYLNKPGLDQTRLAVLPRGNFSEI